MRLRRATEADLPAMRLATDRAYHECQVNLGYRPPAADADIAAAVQRGQAWVGEHASQVVAVLLAAPAGGAFEIESAVVDPAWQGQGFGREMLEHAAELAQEAGCAGVRISSNPRLQRAIAQYESCGFKAEGERPHPVRGTEALRDLVRPV